MVCATDIKNRSIRRDEPMSRHTSWRIGGPVDIYFRPTDRTELCEFLRQLDPDMPLLWLGLGSNLLVRDGGFRGVVIATSQALGEVSHDGHGMVFAEAGVPCAKVAKNCARWKYANAHFFAGIPGTVGGALAMNAGAFGGETWDHVVDIETVDREGVIRTFLPEDFDVAYRSVKSAREEWFLAARFKFELSEEEIGAQIKNLLAKRKASQPMGLPSCGSVFRNPPGDYAARLIEACGLKGHQLGGASVSDKHANFIINTDQASAQDVESLIELIQQRVSRQFKIELIPEVKVVGEAL